MKARLTCNKCGGLKFIGDPYHAYGTYYVDVTCVVCSDSKDISVDRLNKFLRSLEKGVNVNQKTDTE